MERQQKEEEEWQQKLKDEQELDTFLKESANIVMQAPSGHKLKDMARYQVVVRDKTVPEGSLRELDADKKVCMKQPFLRLTIKTWTDVSKSVSLLNENKLKGSYDKFIM